MTRIAKIFSAATIGLDSFLVEVEVDIGAGLPSFTIVGLGDKAIDESKERIRAATKNSGVMFPQHRLTINLAPADIKKEGPSFDLPMAVGVLVANEQVENNNHYEKSLFIGELSLNGNLRHVNGVLPVTMFAQKSGIDRIYLPEVNAEEASLIKDIEIYPVKSLKQLVKHLRGEELISVYQRAANSKQQTDDLDSEFDFEFIVGQGQAKRALEIAAAGNHNVLLSGPPGSGKTLLARSITTILPEMDDDEMLDVTKIYSVGGMFNGSQSLISQRPFRSPHHTTSSVALIGGGAWPKPGEVSLSHRGVLFLDEFPEFPRSVLEALRQPLEDGVVTISRAQGSLTFPAEFLLVAAQNPCPCGFMTDPGKQCTCSPNQVIKYQKKISGPLLDRIDIHVEVPRLEYEKFASETKAESSKTVRERVQKARNAQAKRFEKLRMKSNSEIGSKHIKEFCQLEEGAEKLISHAVNQMKLSARVYHRLLKVARTIADLENKETITADHIAEALQYRPKEKTY